MARVREQGEERQQPDTEESEERLATEGVHTIGLDEAGRGCAFGPFMASAAILPSHIAFDMTGLTDSKKMTDRNRRRFYETLTASDSGVCFGLGVVTNDEIDEHGLGECQHLVFARALEDLQRKHPTKIDRDRARIIVDGNVFSGWRQLPFECVPKADSKFACVSAASVIAKVSRDRHIELMCDHDPELHVMYGLRSNKGYLTKAHIDGIHRHGKCKWHRHSYRIPASTRNG